MEKNTKAAIALGVLFTLTIAGFVITSGVQSTWWTVDVSIVKIEDIDLNTTRGEDGTMVAKLYIPNGVDTSNPAPAVLAIHGYNNDKDVQRPHAIELSKRGIVVLAVDELNHGDSDNVDRGTSNDLPEAALNWLGNQTYVDSSKIGITGHSFGAFNTYGLAAKYPHVAAVAPIAFGAEIGIFWGGYFGLRAMGMDILHVASWGEEFFRDHNETIDMHLQDGLDAMNMLLSITDADYDTTYGDFNSAVNPAFRCEMLKKTHPGQTHSRKSTVAITAFFLQSLLDYSEEDAYASINMGNTIYWLADLAGVLSLAALVFSIIPLAILLISIKFFGEVGQPMPKYRETYAPKPLTWWIFGLINAALGFLTFMFNTQYSPIDPATADAGTWVLDGDMIGGFFREYNIGIFKSAIGNAYLAFYVVNAGIMILLVLVWRFFIYQKKDVRGYQLGMRYNIPRDELAEGQKAPNGWIVFGKTMLVALILIVYMYLVALGASFLKVEVRGPWTALKVLTWARALEFLVYYPGILLFFIFNAGVWMFGMMRQREYETEAKTIFIWWIKICVVMLSGLILLNLLQYVPMYLGLTGPWLNRFSFAPMMVLQLWDFYPYAAAFFLILIIFYRKTGKIWLGSFTVSAIATWMLVAGKLMYASPL